MISVEVDKHILLAVFLTICHRQSRANTPVPRMTINAEVRQEIRTALAGLSGARAQQVAVTKNE